MSETSQNIDINLRTTGAGAAATDVAMVGEKVVQLGAQSKAASVSSKNLGMAANAVSYQLQDFAVQVGSGTSAITAFSQQAPQMIGGLQMAGAVTGKLSLALSAVAVAIPILLLGGRALANALNSGAEAADVFGEAIKKNVSKAADSLGKLDTQKLHDAYEDAKGAVENEALLAKQYHATQQAENAAAVSAISNAENNVTAQDLVSEALGVQVDHYQSIVELAALHLQATRLEAKAKIDAINADRESAENEAMKVSKEIALGQQKEADLKKNLAIQQEILNKIVAQNTAAESGHVKRMLESPKLDALGGAVEVAALNPLGFEDIGKGLQRSREIKMEEDVYAKGAEWRKNLEEAQRSRVDQIINDLKAAEEANRTADAKLTDINKQINDTDAAAVTKIGEISENLKSAEFLQKSKAVESETKQLASAYKTTVEKIETHNAASTAAKDYILSAASDGQITSEEAKQAAIGLRTLIGSLQVGTATVNGNVQELIRIVDGLISASKSHEQQISALKQK